MMLPLLFTTIAILFTWMLIILILAGTGSFLMRIAGFHQFKLTFFIVSFWIGFAAFLVVDQVWNIFRPADWRLWAIFACLT